VKCYLLLSALVCYIQLLVIRFTLTDFPKVMVPVILNDSGSFVSTIAARLTVKPDRCASTLCQALEVFGGAELVMGIRGFAVVEVQDSLYYVHTLAKPVLCTNHASAMKKKLLGFELVGSTADIHEIRPLSRYLQRLFQWGDVKTMTISAAQDWRVNTLFRLHPINPLPFSVVDYDKMGLDLKLEWIRSEFKHNPTISDLPDFWKLCRELFYMDTEVDRTVPLVLKLFSKYSNIEVAKQSDLPPEIREELSVAMGKPIRLCHECGCKLDGARGEDNFCSGICKRAFYPMQFRCPKCSFIQAGKATSSSTIAASPSDMVMPDQFMVTEFYECGRCGHEVGASSMHDSVRGVIYKKSPLEPNVDRQDEPAWKRHRRT